jgi:lysophospholipase L1-like esterase
MTPTAPAAMERPWLRRGTAVLGALCLLAAPAGARAQEADAKGWVTAWATALQGPLPAGFAVGNPPTDSPEWTKMFPNSQVSDATFRLIVRPSADGEQIRLRFSNVMGDRPVALDGITIATRGTGKAIEGASRKPVSFGGQNRAMIPVGGEALSDVIPFAVTADKDVAVTFHVAGASGAITWHAKAMVTSYMTASGGGDKTSDDSGTDLAYQLRSWVWLSELQAYKSGQPDRMSIVALGDSITDGSASTIDGYDRWGDFLNKRLRAAGSDRVVVNAGIGGNRVTTLRLGPVLANTTTGSSSAADTLCAPCGPPAVTRLERDIFSRPNVAAIILFEGVNDVGAGGSHGDIIAGMQDIVLLAHARGIKVFGATITPYYGFAYDVVYPDQTRRQVNDWMRNTKIFDGLFDLDAVVRDPDYPARIKPGLDAPDHIHLNPKGYEVVANSIPLSALDPKLAK